MSPILGAVILASARTWALLRVQASWRWALGAQWQWLSAALAVVVALLVSQGTARFDPPVTNLDASLLAALAIELLLGTVLGLLASLPGFALVGAMNQASAKLGLDEAQPTLSRVLVMASLAAGLGLGLHAPLLTGLLGTFDALPLGDPQAWLAKAAALDPNMVIAAAITMTVLALALATPVLLTELVTTLALTCLVRPGDTAERALADVLGPGLRFATALLALGAAWSAYPEAFARGM